MVSLIEQNLPAIRDLCRKHGVQRLELFGSAARNDFTTDSDIDFFVEFLSADWHGAADRWFGLQEDLAALLGHDVDLTSLQKATNPYFLQVANRHRIHVYAA